MSPDGKNLIRLENQELLGLCLSISLIFPNSLFSSFSVCEKLPFCLSEVEFKTKPLRKHCHRSRACNLLLMSVLTSDVRFSRVSQYPVGQWRGRTAIPALQAERESTVSRCWEKGKYLIRLYKQCRLQKCMKWSCVKIQWFSFKKDIDLSVGIQRRAAQNRDWKNCSCITSRRENHGETA